jgi:hypothetical protein
MKKQILTLVFFILPGVVLCGCIDNNIVTGEGVIRYIELEGGFYGIISEDQRYDPINLPEDFKEDGLKIEFKLKILKDRASIHMWGKIVEIIELKKL